MQSPSEKGLTMIYRTLHKKLKIDQHEPAFYNFSVVILFHYLPSLWPVIYNTYNKRLVMKYIRQKHSMEEMSQLYHISYFKLKEL
jgi:hypothetical protein